MSIQIEQAITSRLEPTDVHVQAKKRATALWARFDTDTVFGVIMTAIIWGCFVAALWSLQGNATVKEIEPVVKSINFL